MDSLTFSEVTFRRLVRPKQRLLFHCGELVKAATPGLDGRIQPPGHRGHPHAQEAPQGQAEGHPEVPPPPPQSFLAAGEGCFYFQLRSLLLSFLMSVHHFYSEKKAVKGRHVLLSSSCRWKRECLSSLLEPSSARDGLWLPPEPRRLPQETQGASHGLWLRTCGSAGRARVGRGTPTAGAPLATLSLAPHPPWPPRGPEALPSPPPLRHWDPLGPRSPLPSVEGRRCQRRSSVCTATSLQCGVTPQCHHDPGLSTGT